MASVNKTIILGHCGRDPEMRRTAEGLAVTHVSIATSRRFNNAAGQQQDETEWHRVTFLGRLAEISGEYLKKGRPVYVEGRLKTRKWADKDGQDRYTTEIVAENLQLLGSRTDEEPAGKKPDSSTTQATQQRAVAVTEGVETLTDDIPF